MTEYVLVKVFRRIDKFPLMDYSHCFMRGTIFRIEKKPKTNA
jgi:hypothetical protein